MLLVTRSTKPIVKAHFQCVVWISKVFQLLWEARLHIFSVHLNVDFGIFGISKTWWHDNNKYLCYLYYYNPIETVNPERKETLLKCLLKYYPTCVWRRSWSPVAPLLTWIINYIHCNVWDEITYPFPNFWEQVWEWLSNFIPHFIAHVITYPCLSESWIALEPWIETRIT